jgi:hypothetical protein
MNSSDAQKILDAEQRRRPLSEYCDHCGTSRSSLRALHQYRGCQVCSPRNGEWGGPIEERTLEDMRNDRIALQKREAEMRPVWAAQRKERERVILESVKNLPWSRK